MIWLTWRQHRQQMLFALAGLAVVTALMMPTGLHMRDVYASSGLAGCLPTAGHAEFVARDDTGYRACEALAADFSERFYTMAPLAILFVFLPLLLGLFLGAPLVAREVEHGTHRLVWTQSISRRRWTAVKVGTIGAAALALATGYAALLTWWITPLAVSTDGRLAPLFFDLQGVVPVAYTLFAVALGIFAGTVARRTLPAMAATLVGFATLRIVVATLARPRFLPHRERTFPEAGLTTPNRLLGDWILSRSVHDAAGRQIAANTERLCRAPAATAPPSPTPRGACLDTLGPDAYNLQAYQPAGRFWPFQYIEAGVFLTLAAILVYLALRHIRRRIT